MGFAYVIRDQGAVHFVTFTVHQWADVFTRQQYVEEFLESVEYCQNKKGLEVYAWVLRVENKNLSDVIRDLKKLTSEKIYKVINENPRESRKAWLPKY